VRPSSTVVIVGLVIALAALAVTLFEPSDHTLALALVFGGGTAAYLLAIGILRVGGKLRSPRPAASTAAPSSAPAPEPTPAPEAEAPAEAAPTPPSDRTVRDRLRVLLILSRPLDDGAGAAPARASWRAITQALSEGQPDLELVTLWPPTEANLEGAMRATPQFHLLVIDAPLSGGLPLIEGETGQARLLSPTRLASHLSTGGVRTVIIHGLGEGSPDAQALLQAGVETVISVPGALEGPAWTETLAQLLSGLVRGGAVGRALSDLSALMDSAERPSRLRPTLAGANWYSLVDRGSDGLGLRLLNQPFVAGLRDQPWFRGRGALVAELLAAAQPGSARQLNVASPGSGITSLAIEAAHRLASAYERVVHVECSALARPDLNSVLEAIALSLRCTALDEEALFDSVATALRTKPTLVLVDQADLLEDPERERLLSLDEALNRSTVIVLVTSPDLESAPLGGEGMDTAGAAALVRWLSSQDGFQVLGDMSPRSIEALVEGVSANPLAIRLALGLADQLGLLQMVRSAREARTLGNVLSLALARLSQRERDAATALALVPAPLPDDVLSAALGRDSRPTLEALRRRGLTSDALFEGDFRLHPLVREQLAAQAADGQVLKRLAEALAAHARALTTRLEDEASADEAISEVISLLPSLETVLSWTSSDGCSVYGRLDLVRDICLALVPALQRRGLLYAALRMAIQGQEAATRLNDHAARARFLLGAAAADRAAGRIEDASFRYAEAAEAFEMARDYRRAAKALVEQGTMHWQDGRPLDARPPFERALAWLERVGDVAAQANALMVLGYIAGQEDTAREAEAYYLKATRLLDGQEGMHLARAQAHYALGRTFAEQGRYQEACDEYSRALDAFSATGDTEGRLQAYRALGQACLRMNDRERAVEVLERAAQLEERAPFGLDATMDLLRVYMKERRWQDALGYQQRALGRALAAGHKRDLALAHNGMGSVLLELGNRKEAQGHFLEAARLWQELGDDVGLAWTHNNMAVASRRAGKWDEARQHLDEAARLLERRGDKNALASVYNNIGLILAAQRRTREAAKFYERSLALKEELGDLYGARITTQNLQSLSRRD
jgi:tetratricopeptide (TPR) repeat protein